MLQTWKISLPPECKRKKGRRVYKASELVKTPDLLVPNDEKPPNPFNAATQSDLKYIPQVPRMKLIQFHENVRPPYYGTWTKTSPDISSRNPFGRDNTSLVDYDVDSDEEWEQDLEGDDCDSDEEEEDFICDDEDDYEVRIVYTCPIRQ